MEDQEVLKMNFLNENIIEKGMDPENFFEFIKKKTNKEYDSLELDKIKELFNEFNKGEGNNKEEGKEKEKEESKDKSNEKEKKKDEEEKKKKKKKKKKKRKKS